jgi:hypothetical protein
MKQYRITSQNFMPQEPTIPDAVMDDADLHRMKQLAGIAEDTGAMSNAYGNMSPLGATDSNTAAQKRDIERDKNIKPGSDEWFRLWFAKEKLTGEKPTDTGKSKNTLFSKNPDK